MGFETEAEYRDSIRQELVLEYADRMIRQKENEVYTAVINGSEITMPENLLEYYEEDIKTMYTNEAAIYGMDLRNPSYMALQWRSSSKMQGICKT